jgi:tetratricopeptide (TPR) repeat protein
MLETVRAYAALELAARGERDDAMAGLARHYMDEAATAPAGLVGPAQGEWLNRVREDLDNYRGAMTWLLDHGRPADAGAIAYGVFIFWVIRGHATEGLEWYGRVLAQSPLPPISQARALVSAASLHYTQGQIALARAALTGAFALVHMTPELEWLPQAELIMGHVEHASANYRAAGESFERSLQVSRQARSRWHIGNSLCGLAWVALSTGELVTAQRFVDESLVAFEGTGPWFLLLPLYIRAILAVRRGDADEAIARVRESLGFVRSLGDKFAFVYALVPLVAAAVLKGDDAWAARVLGARDAVTEQTGLTVADQSVDDLHEMAERDARARLGPDRWARAYAAGRTSTIDSLLEDIDRRVG